MTTGRVPALHPRRNPLAASTGTLLLFVVLLLALPAAPALHAAPAPTRAPTRAPAAPAGASMGAGGSAAPGAQYAAPSAGHPPAAPAFLASGLTVTGSFMPWVCQFCTWAGSESAFATEYAPYAYNMTQLSYEMYKICSGGGFCSRGYETTSNDLTPFAHQYGIRALPMLTSATTTDIQAVVSAAGAWGPFIGAAINTSLTYGYGGYNIDWEPSPDVSALDGYHYAHFLDAFANASHAHSKILTVDYARWDPHLWNLAALAKTTVDLFMDMNYECPGTTFTSYLNGDVAAFPLAHLGEALDPESGCTDAQMVQLLGQITTAGVTNSEWWALDDAAATLDNAHLWTAVHDFVYQGAYNGTTSQGYAASAWGLATNEVPVAPLGGALELFTLGTDEQGYMDASVYAGTAISSVALTMRVSLNPANYALYEGNVSATGTIISSWKLLPTNQTLSLGAPTGGTATEIFFELASDPGGSPGNVGNYQVGYPGTYAFLQVQINGGAPPPLTAGATSNVSSGTAPLTVGFAGTASGGTSPYTWSWRFGDGGASASQNPSHTFLTGGTFTPTLIVNDSAGHTAQAQVAVAVAPGALAASATSNVTSGCAPLSVQFSGSGSGGTLPYTFAWDFGDGSAPSTQASPTHVYGTPGNFSVVLTVTDSTSATATAPITMQATSCGGGALGATASATPTSGAGPLTVVFTGGASGGTAPYGYAWAFGDGSAGSLAQDPTHTYNMTGSFTAVLTVTDQASTVATARVAVQVTNGGSGLAVTLQAPATAVVGAAATFTAAASGGTAPYPSFAWAFGDTTSSMTPTSSTSHVYTTPGTYSVTVTVTDSAGAIATSSPASLTVVAPTEAVAITQVRNGSSSAPLAGAVLTILLVSTGGVVATFTTPANGTSRTNVAPGSYLFNVTATGYRSAQQVVTLLAGPPAQVYFNLSWISVTPKGGGGQATPGLLAQLLGDPVLLLGLLALLVGVIALAAFVVHRRRRRAPPLDEAEVAWQPVPLEAEGAGGVPPGPPR